MGAARGAAGDAAARRRPATQPHSPRAPADVVEGSKAKPRKFQETIELQIGLKNYDPQKDKRFSGTVRLPFVPRPRMKVCVLGDVKHCEQAGAIGVDAKGVEDLKKLNKNKKLVKKLGRGPAAHRGARQGKSRRTSQRPCATAPWAHGHRSSSSLGSDGSLSVLCPRSPGLPRLPGLGLGHQADSPSARPRPQQGRQVPGPHQQESGGDGELLSWGRFVQLVGGVSRGACETWKEAH